MEAGAVILHYRYWPGVRSTIEALLPKPRPRTM
jgi:hypothetical protein